MGCDGTSWDVTGLVGIYVRSIINPLGSGITPNHLEILPDGLFLSGRYWTIQDVSGLLSVTCLSGMNWNELE